MKTKIIFSICCLFIVLQAMSQESPSPTAETFFKKAISEINPRHVAWIKSTAATIKDKNLSEADASKMTLQYGAANKLDNLSIEALTALVMMQATKNAEADLRATMAAVKETNEQKKKIRELQNDFRQHKNELSKPQLDSVKLVARRTVILKTTSQSKIIQPVKVAPVKTIGNTQSPALAVKPTNKEIETAENEIKDKLDSLNEMGEEQSLRLQMAMDRKSKMLSTSSNMLKKIADTQSEVISNLK